MKAIDLDKFKGHTLGPWTTDPEDDYILRTDDFSTMIGQVRGWGWIQKLPNGRDIQIANCRLMAAAPDLLQECLRLREENERFSKAIISKLDERLSEHITHEGDYIAVRISELQEIKTLIESLRTNTKAV